MKRILRLFLTLLMLVAWASGFAQEVTLDFTNSKTWNLPVGSKNIVKTQKSYSNGTYSITINASAGHYLVGSKENNYSLLLGKKDATLTLPAFNFDVKKIIQKKTTQTSSEKTTQNIYVGSKAVSTQTTSANIDQTYKIQDGYQAAGNIYVLKVTNSNNTQFSKIEIYKAASTKTATTLNFPQPAINIEGGNEASFKGQTATLKAGVTVLDKAIAYAKSGDDIFATFDATTGAATLKSGVYGSATITATFAGDDTYEKSTASYDLTVVDPNKSEVTFNFSDCTKYGYQKPSSNSNRTELNIGDVIKSSPVTITVVDEGSTKVGFATTYLGVYQGSTLKLEIEDGYVLNKVSFERNGTNNTLSINANNAGETWTGEASSVTLSVPDKAKGTQVKTITVKYSKLANSLTLSETDADTDSKIANNNGKTVDVTLTRTLTAGAWNTICLPFDVTAEQIADVLKSTGNVKEFDREDASKQTIYFKDATTMVAGKPYLIKPTESAKELVFKGVTIKNVDAVDRMVGDKYNMRGVFGKYVMNTNGTELFLKTDGKFYVPAEGKETMKGFRAYFLVPKSTAAAALNLSFGDATGINGVAADAEKNVKVYNVNGQYVGTSLEALPKGLYIVGGKKVLK